jgi:hypothetical protein
MDGGGHDVLPYYFPPPKIYLLLDKLHSPNGRGLRAWLFRTSGHKAVMQLSTWPRLGRVGSRPQAGPGTALEAVGFGLTIQDSGFTPLMSTSRRGPREMSWRIVIFSVSVAIRNVYCDNYKSCHPIVMVTSPTMMGI